jgi:alkylation response protein AidB-like acyl-CoA dehydrogenase
MRPGLAIMPPHYHAGGAACTASLGRDNLPAGGAMANERRITRAEVIERARGIAAAVAPQVERAEKLRRMPPENVKAMMDSGLMPMMRPARFGGFGGDWLDLLKVCTGFLRAGRQGAPGRRGLGAERGMALGLGR